MKKDFLKALVCVIAISAISQVFAFKQPDLERLKSTLKCSGGDLSEADLSGMDLTCADLSETNLSSANLTKANFDCTDLSGAVLDDATLAGAQILYSILDGASFKRTNLTNAKLTIDDLRFDVIAFDYCNISSATFEGEMVQHLNLSRCYYLDPINKPEGLDVLTVDKQPKLGDVILNKQYNTIYLDDCTYSSVYISHIVNSSFNGPGVHFYKSTFTGEIKDSKFIDRSGGISSSFFDNTFTGSKIEGCTFIDFNFGGEGDQKVNKLNNMIIRNTTFKNCNFMGADFKGTKFENVKFENCSLTFSDFTGTAYDNKFDLSSCNYYSSADNMPKGLENLPLDKHPKVTR